MGKIEGSLFALVAVLTAIGPVYGNLIGPSSPVQLERNSDAIVFGTASVTSAAEPVSSLSLRAARVIKGDPALAGATISVSWIHPQSGMIAGQAAAATSTGLWFLKDTPVGWQLLPVVQGNVSLGMAFYPAQAGPLPAAYSYDATASVADKLASEICSAIEGLNGGYSLQLYSLEHGLLDQLNSPVILLHYQRMSTSVVPQQRILGLSGLIRAGSATALAASAEGASSFKAHAMENGILLASIRDHFRSTDGVAIATLGQSAIDGSKPTAFRETAAHALAAVHTSTALPYLAVLLDDPDQDLRIEAVGGMAAFANGLGVQTQAGVPSLAFLQLPAGAPYKTTDTLAHLAFGRQAIAGNEPYYVPFWKNWWAQNRAGLGY